MKQVAVFNTRIEAEAWCVDLQENAIPYILLGNDCGGANPLIGMVNGVKVLVADEQVENVTRIKEGN